MIKCDGAVFAATIARNIAWVWLNTNWRECLLSRRVFIAALTTARILQLVGPKDEEDPIQWPSFVSENLQLDSKREKYKGKPGYTWRYPSSISSPAKIGLSSIISVSRLLFLLELIVEVDVEFVNRAILSNVISLGVLVSNRKSLSRKKFKIVCKCTCARATTH